MGAEKDAAGQMGGTRSTRKPAGPGDAVRGGPSGRREWIDSWCTPDPLFGTFIQFAGPSIVEILGYAGLDFVIIDLEHGEFGLAEVPDLCRAAELSGLHAIVRVTSNDPVEIGKSLDFGASAILVPHIETAAEASAAVAAAKYPPIGDRGAYPVLRAARYGAIHAPGWEARENERTSVILLIEGTTGIANLPEIVKTPGVDGIFIGPVDLSHSLGLAGQTDNPRVRTLVSEAGATATASGLRAGTFCPTSNLAAEYAREGFKLLACGVDSQVLLSGYAAAREAFRAAVEGTEHT